MVLHARVDLARLAMLGTTDGEAVRRAAENGPRQFFAFAGKDRHAAVAADIDAPVLVDRHARRLAKGHGEAARLAVTDHFRRNLLGRLERGGLVVLAVGSR